LKSLFAFLIYFTRFDTRCQVFSILLKAILRALALRSDQAAKERQARHEALL
jgi:hypothetical protein